MKRILSFLLVALMVLSAVVTASAETADATQGVGTYGTDWVYYGDVNADKEINAKDALSVLKNAVGKEQFTDVQQKVADVNVDTTINAKDALDMLKLSVGKLGRFTAGVFYQITQLENSSVEEYIANYNKGNSVNNAYIKDTTADTSYSLDISDLDSATIYSISSGAWSNQADVANTDDIKRVIFSLQGLVNRDFGTDVNHTTLIYIAGGTDDNAWLKEMQQKGSIMYSSTTDGVTEGMKTVKVNKYDAFIETFLPVLKKAGMILWDGNVPATANVAATICGLDGYLPVLKNSPLHKTLEAAGVPVKMDLYGKFKDGRKGQKITGTSVDSTGSAKNDAYLWAMEKYFDRCTSRYLGYTLDGAPTVKGYTSYTDNPIALSKQAGSNCLSNHDYLIARRAFFFDLAPYKGEAACDDPAQKNGKASIGTDYATMTKLFAKRYQRANGAFGALMGFPPWWLKYTAFDSQGSKGEVWNEWLFTEIITCYNMAKEADAAQPSFMYNGSLMYKYVPAAKSYQNNKKKENISFDKNTYYYAIYVGDYDSSAWLKQHIFNMWIRNGGDRHLKDTTLMWSINPNLSDRIPVVFEYMFKNKTDNQYFVGGDGGAGYVFPSALFQGSTLAYMGEKRPNPDAGNAFAQFSKTYYDRFQMDITGFLINGQNGAINAKAASCINQYSPVGSFVNAGTMAINKYNGTYYVNCHVGIDKTNAQTTMYSFATTGMGRGLNFGAYRTICHTPSEIYGNVTKFATYAADKGMKVKYCDPYTYFDLLKQSGQGTEIR